MSDDDIFNHATYEELQDKRKRFEEGNSTVADSIRRMFENGRRLSTTLVRDADREVSENHGNHGIELDTDSLDGSVAAENNSCHEDDIREMEELGIEAFGDEHYVADVEMGGEESDLESVSAQLPRCHLAN